jgi:hypothetical protein
VQSISLNKWDEVDKKKKNNGFKNGSIGNSANATMSPFWTEK